MRLLLCLPACVFLVHAGSACGTGDTTLYEAALQSLAKRASKGPPKNTTIQNVRFFDGYGFTAPQTIVFSNGIITRVGQPKKTTSEVQIDGTGKFLLPGLIDSHSHIASPANLDAMASYGVTTAVNMACYNTTFCAALMNLSGTASMLTGSVPAVSSISVLGALAGEPTNAILSPGDDTTARVNEHAFFPGSPVQFVKVVATPGGLTQELLNGLVNSAREKGYHTAMHASHFSAYEQAIIARPKIIQHLPGDQVMSPDVAKAIFNQGQLVTPTMSMFQIGINSPLVKQITGQNISWATIVANAAMLYKAGVPLLAGTDVATVGNITMPYGLTLHCELEFLVEAGVPPAEALHAATSRPAKARGWPDRGQIAVGKRADLLLLNANPLLNITNTRDVARVWTGGIEFTDVKRDLRSKCSQLNATFVV